MIGNLQKILNQNGLVLIDFHAQWCGPCKTMAPILEKVKKHQGDKVKILKIDVDKNQKIATALDIRGVPTLILYKNGSSIWRKSGIVDDVALNKLIENNV